MTERLLHDFEVAWDRLRAVVEDDGSLDRKGLINVVDDAVHARSEARETLARQHNGYWIGDQVLYEREVKVGALARELDGFVEEWPFLRERLSSEAIASRVRSLLVEPGNAQAHMP